ncbi:Uncharacterised protein [Klebsiella pneumoniae]|nr:Uncharacterised protein [Klebsiella pneumoniae]
MAHGAIQQGNRLLQAQLLRLVHNECPARDKRRPVLQGRFACDGFSGQPRIPGEKIPGAVIGSEDMHVAPLLPGHQRQLGHPLPLARSAALTGDNPHRRTVLRQDADRIAEGSLAHHRRVGRDGDVVLPLNFLAERFHGELIKDVNV